MNDSTALQAIFDRLSAGKRLRQQELQTLVAAIRSQQITIATGDRAVSIGGSADDAVIVTGDHNVVITGTGAEVLRDLMGKRPRAEKLLLQAVKGEVTSRLKQSLHHAILIQLGMEAQPEQVQRPWDSDIKIGNQTFEPILDDWNILQVFYEVQGKLLILGNPGSGKTTTLLELAQALCDRAEQDMEFPIPILFNLSTWKDNEQLLQNWLVEELKSKYGVRKDIAAKWIGEAALLPMLDGLDELASVRQEFCIKQINKLLESESRPEFLVVCSRWEEYNIKTAKLHLNGAVFLQPLEAVKICNYLVGVKKEGLWQIIKTNPSLLELVKNSSTFKHYNSRISRYCYWF